MTDNVIEFAIKGVDQFTGPLGKVSGVMGGMVKAVAGAAASMSAATGAVVGFVSAVTSGMDTTAKASRRLGETTEAFTSIQYLASTAGVDVENFAGIMQTLNKNAVDAPNGVGRARETFYELGISAQSFANMRMEDRMKVLAEKISAVQSPTEQLAMATKLFGEQGAQMVEVLKNGEAGFSDATAEARKFGVVLSQQAAANAEAFQDSLGRVGSAIKGISQGIANELSPVLTGMANLFADKLASMRGSIIEFVKLGIQYFFTFVEVLKQFKDGVVRAFSTREGFSNFLDNLGKLIEASGVALLAFAQIFWSGLKHAFFVGADIVVGFAKWMWGKLTGADVGDFSDTMAGELADAFNNAKASISAEIAEPLSVLKQAFAEAGTAAADMFGINIDLAKMKAMETIASISQYGEVVKEVVGTTTEHTLTLMEAMSVKGSEFLESLRFDALSFAEEFYGVMSGAIQSISDGIAQVMVEGGSMRDVFNNVSRQVLQSLISMLVKIGIQRLVLAGITKAAVGSEAASMLSTAYATTYANAYAATAIIPVVGPALAPGVASTALAGAIGGSTAAAATGALIGSGMSAAHGGMTNVPSEQTYLLDRGERVLSPNQNADFTEFMKSGGGAGGGVVIENLTIHILENATNADAILGLSKIEMDRLVAGPIIDSLNRLDAKGIRQNALERKRS